MQLTCIYFKHTFNTLPTYLVLCIINTITIYNVYEHIYNEILKQCLISSVQACVCSITHTVINLIHINA